MIVLYILVLCCSLFVPGESYLNPQIQPLLTSKHGQLSESVYTPDTCGLEVPVCDPTYKYRSYDGSCNNLDHPTWGMAKSAFVRLFEPRYGDGVELPPVGVDGTELPNARVLVTSLLEDKDNPDSVSLIVAQWAQFIAHDFAASYSKEGESDCCAEGVDPLICYSVQIPSNDAFYSQFNKTCQAVVRSQTALTGDCNPDGFKSPVNLITHGLDGSVTYGSDEAAALKLRELKDGRMLTSTSADGRQFLPTGGSCYNSNVCYVAGEGRVNQNTQLTIMHTILVREHNRVAEWLKLIHPLWDDETLYQEARAIVVAEYLHITFNEFLTYVLPDSMMVELGLKSNGFYSYSSEIPNIVLVSFANPIFRIFHSGLQGVITLYNYILEPESYINLTDYMNSPGILEEDDDFDKLTLGVITQPMQSIDEFYTAQISTMLFHLGKAFGSDLNSLDIQRPRDFGTPAYTTLLAACTGTVVDSFDDLATLWPADKIENVQKLYSSVHDIDPFVGVNFEIRTEGHRFSPVMECIIGEQFYRWKNGDRFWYEIQNQPHSFTPAQQHEIRKATLSRLICDTSDNIVNITKNAWLPPSDSNPIVPCSTIPGINFIQWI